VDPLGHALTSAAAAFAPAMAQRWAPVTGVPTWPALAGGRLASTAVIALASFAYALPAEAAGVWVIARQT
jgi:hypothetical protein